MDLVPAESSTGKGETSATPREQGDPTRLVKWDEVSYRALTDRRGKYDTLIWQTPALVIAAEAFLLNVALNPASSQTSREIAALVGFVVVLLSIQVMAKNRYLEREDNLLIHELELARENDQPGRYFAYHGSVAEREFERHRRAELQASKWVSNQQGWLAARSSVYVWYLGLGFIATVDAVILVVAVLGWKVF